MEIATFSYERTTQEACILQYDVQFAEIAMHLKSTKEEILIYVEMDHIVCIERAIRIYRMTFGFREPSE